MARPLRLEYPGAVWHVMSRGNNRGDIFFAMKIASCFLRFSATGVRRFRWILHEFVLMTNHYHLSSRLRREPFPAA